MSLDFAAASSDRVDCGSPSLSLLSTGFTVMAWMYNDAIDNNRHVISRGNGSGQAKWRLSTASGTGPTNGPILQWIGSAGLTYIGTTVFSANQWNFIAAVVNPYVSAKIYKGTLTSAAAEMSYSTSTPGSSYNDDASNAIELGNRFTTNGSSQALDGKLGPTILVSRQLTTAEIVDWQWRPRVIANTEGFWRPGANGTSTQPDWSGKGRNGTVTGAVVAADVPLGPWFGFDTTRPPYVSAAPGFTAVDPWGQFGLFGI